MSDSDSESGSCEGREGDDCSIVNNVNPEKPAKKDRSDDLVNCYIKFVIEIEDSGVGIPADKLPNIFMDFMKIDAHKKINPSGTGLGLSICKLIVEKMRGKINVDSKENIGTTF